MITDLTTRQAEVGIFLPPDIVLENARTAARALADVISKKKKPVIMNGEQYLEMEDWQLCGQFYGYTVKTGDAVLVEIDGVKGAKAHADLIDFKTGMYLGGAEAYCMRDEEHWNTRPKYEWQGEGDNRKRVKVGDEVVPWFQLASMAQTRAGAKAFRNRLAWVVVLAGYRPTPAEEMTEGTVSEAVKERRTVDKSEHYCELHGVNYFKKGNMKGYAHKLPDGSWCNEPPKQSPSEPPEEAVTPTTEVLGGDVIEAPAWEAVRTGLTALYNKKVEGWSTIDSLVKKMVKLGATANGKAETTYSTLPDEGKVKFAGMVDQEVSKLA